MDIIWLVLSFTILGFSAIIHECAHGWVAYKLGDNTAYYQGRITLNPLKHIDPFMTIILPVVLFFTSGFVFGGAKPVPINPYNFRDSEKGMMLSSLAGPFSNLLLAIIGFCFFLGFAFLANRTTFNHSLLEFNITLFYLFIYINILLALFNIIPIPPLDGSRILRYFLPWDMKASLDRIEPFGFIIIMVLVVTGGFSFLNLLMAKLNYFLISFIR
ncbi:MAG: site-2 protease family protein [Planctomycetes bacterium]|nr:site-2 protease family protein [Planctomycetota bacterium]